MVKPAVEKASDRQVGHLLGAIFSACPDAVLVVDDAGTIVLSNPAVTSLFCYYPRPRRPTWSSKSKTAGSRFR